MTGVSQAEARQQRLALIALLLGAVMIGFSPIFVRWSEVGPITTGFYRILLALPFFLLWRASDRQEAAERLPVSPREHQRNRCYAAVAGLCLGLDLAFWHSSLAHISVANATLLANLAPIFVTLLAWLWWRETIHLRFVGCLLLAIVGVWILVLGDGRRLPGGESLTGLGTLQGIAAAVFYSGYIVTMKRARRSVSLSSAMLISGVATMALLLPLALIAGETLLPPTAMAWVVLVGLAWVAQGLGQGMIAKGLSVLPASFSSLTLLVQPVVAAVLAWALLGEALTLWQLAGGALVLASILLARR